MSKSDFESIYQVLFETISEGLLIVDQHGEIVLANPQAAELLGGTITEVIGYKVESFVPMASRGSHKKLRESYHKDPHKRRMGQNLNLQAIRLDGSHFDVEISLNHFTSNGQMFVVAMLTDITERVSQQKKIQELNENLEAKVEQRTKQVIESQKLYSAIAENFPNGTINVFDEHLNWLFVEGLELREMGLNKEKLIGTSYLEKIPSEIRDKVERELQSVFNGTSQFFEIESKNQFYQINAVPLINGENIVDKILVVEENITQQKMLERQMEEALIKERQLSELKSRFVSMASHEFRTPLSTVLSSVSLIEKYIEKKQVANTHKHIDRVKKAVAGLTEILNDFLSVEKLESNKDVVSKIHFDFSVFIDEIVEEINTILKKGQQIVLSKESETGQIYSDPRILKNVLYNLLSNAIKYSDEGDQIIIKYCIQAEGLQISIIDQGIGIPLEDQKELFGRFFRAKNVINIKGTGLGLSIVKKYVEMLGGNISFESQLNEGTAFHLNIPIE